MNERSAPFSWSHPRERWVINILLVVALVSLTIGVFAPLLSFHKLLLFSNSVSLASGLVELVRQGEWILFLAIGGFSVLLPTVKLALLYRIWNGRVCRRRATDWLHRLAAFGKWSMLEVFVVAVLLVTLRLGALGRVEVHMGLYAFAVSVLVTMAVTARLLHLSRKALPGGVHA